MSSTKKIIIGLVYFVFFYPSLRQHISSINQVVTPRDIATRIARQKQIQPLDLLGISLPPKRNHPQPLRNNLGPSPHLRIKEPRTNNIHARKIAPLARQRLAHVRDERLAAVVNGLVDRHIDNVARDAARQDQVAEALRLEDGAGVLGAVDGAVDVHRHEVSVGVEGL
jgi:hypothetical protein